MSLAVGEYRYRSKARERRAHRGQKPKKLKLFGVSRAVNPQQSDVFMGVLDELPALTGGQIYKDEIRIPRMQLSTIGLFSSAINEKRRRTFEQKDVNQLPSAIKNSLNGGYRQYRGGFLAIFPLLLTLN